MEQSWIMEQRLSDPGSLKHFLSGPVQKKFASSWFSCLEWKAPGPHCDTEVATDGLGSPLPFWPLPFTAVSTSQEALGTAGLGYVLSLLPVMFFLHYPHRSSFTSPDVFSDDTFVNSSLVIHSIYSLSLETSCISHSALFLLFVFFLLSPYSAQRGLHPKPSIKRETPRGQDFLLFTATLLGTGKMFRNMCWMNECSITGRNLDPYDL